MEDSTDYSYVFKNASWNQDIKPGESVEFGFSGDEAFSGFPDKFELLGTKKEQNTKEYQSEYQVLSDWEEVSI